jgi:hypothetical protein
MSHNMSRFESNGSACVILAQRDSLIASNTDISPIINKSLDSVLTKDNRKELSVEILAIHSGHEPYHRLGNNVDKLPALVEAADRSSAERQAMGGVVCSILMDYNSDIAAQLPKVLTKLVGVACRIAVKDDVGSVEYGLQILKALVEYKSRPLMLPHARQVRQTCLQLFAQRSGWNEQSVALIAEVYALYASMESAEAWSAIWVDAVRECASLVGTLGIGANSSGNANHKKGGKKAAQTDNAAQQHGATAELTLLAESNVHTLRGVAKALRVQGLFQCAAALLVQLLSVGCSSGYVGLNVTHLLPLLQLLLSANADVSVKDPVVRAPLTMLIAFVQETWWWDVIKCGICRCCPHLFSFNAMRSHLLCNLLLSVRICVQSYIEGEAAVAPVDVALVLSLMKVGHRIVDAAVKTVWIRLRSSVLLSQRTPCSVITCEGNTKHVLTALQMLHSG